MIVPTGGEADDEPLPVDRLRVSVLQLIETDADHLPRHIMLYYYIIILYLGPLRDCPNRGSFGICSSN